MTGKRSIRLGLLLPLALWAKSYYYPEIRTEVRLASDGSAHIQQRRTYFFDGAFSWAFVDLLKRGADSIRFYRLAESTSAGWQAVSKVEPQENSRSLNIKWWYSAQNEARTFLLEYHVFGAVRRFQDVAEFYWKVIEDEHERISRTTVEVVLPQPAPELFKTYVHSAAEPGRLVFSDRFDRVTVEQAHIPKNTFVEVRVLTAPELFTAVPVQPRPMYRQILAEEQQNFVRTLVRKLVLLPVGLALMVVVPLVLVILFYRRYGREPRIDYEARYEHEPPRKAPPLVVPVIISQKPSRSALRQQLFWGMLATLLELADKGLVTVTETKEGAKRRYRFRLAKPDAVAELEPFSRAVSGFFFGSVSRAGSGFSDEELRRYCQHHATEVSSLLDSFDERATSWWRKELGTDLLSPDSVRAYQRFMIVALAALVVGVLLAGAGLGPLINGFGPGPWIITAVVGFGLAMVFGGAGRSILRWNKTAYLEHRRWQAFRRFLVDFSAIEQAPVQLLAIWEHYYVYAVVLGVAHHFLKNIGRLAEERKAVLVTPAWFVAAGATAPAGSASMAAGLASFDSFVANFGSMMESFSTSTSTGGGFSGGGGGGGGGNSGAG